MKKIVVLIICSALLSQVLPAQSSKKDNSVSNSGKKNSVAAGIAIPIGIFSKSHWGGFSAQYSRSNGRFGLLSKKINKSIGWVGNAGISYYLGKEENEMGYTYQYPGYLFIHMDGGLIYNMEKNGHLSLSAGPGLSLYNSSTRFSIFIQLNASYYLTEKIGMGISISGMKETISDPLWAGSLKVMYIF